MKRLQSCFVLLAVLAWCGAAARVLSAPSLAVLPAAPAAAPHRDNPLLAHTGGFGEPTCTECHFDSPVNPPGGTLSVEGMPERWRPGAGYELTVRLRHPELELGGFQLAVRFAEGPTEGEQAGSLEASDGRAAVRVTPGRAADSGVGSGVALSGSSRGGPIQYAYHTVEGALPTAEGEAVWRLRWTAPEPPEGPEAPEAPDVPLAAVVLHVAANAANHDASEFGDRVYTASVGPGPALLPVSVAAPTIASGSAGRPRPSSRCPRSRAGSCAVGAAGSRRAESTPSAPG